MIIKYGASLCWLRALSSNRALVATVVWLVGSTAWVFAVNPPQPCYDEKVEVACSTPHCMCQTNPPAPNQGVCVGTPNTWVRGTFGDATEDCLGVGDNFVKTQLGDCGAAEIYPAPPSCIWNAGNCQCPNPIDPRKWVPAGGGWRYAKVRCDPCP
jgi:hypothetical protein